MYDPMLPLQPLNGPQNNYNNDIKLTFTDTARRLTLTALILCLPPAP